MYKKFAWSSNHLVILKKAKIEGQWELSLLRERDKTDNKIKHQQASFTSKTQCLFFEKRIIKTNRFQLESLCSFIPPYWNIQTCHYPEYDVRPWKQKTNAEGTQKSIKFCQKTSLRPVFADLKLQCDRKEWKKWQSSVIHFLLKTTISFRLKTR